MFEIAKSIDIDFAHHVSGHPGACINIHGHTWKFEIGVHAKTLNETGFVVDFKELKHKVLRPVHILLDHSLALSEVLVRDASVNDSLAILGKALHKTREGRKFCSDADEVCAENLGYSYFTNPSGLYGGWNEIIGGLKIAVFDFNPTSERLAKWLYTVAQKELVVRAGSRIGISFARIYETLHPVESVCTYRP